jgi:hypothetical protein
LKKSKLAPKGKGSTEEDAGWPMHINTTFVARC